MVKGCSINFFVYLIEYLKKEYGDKSVNQDQLSGFIDLITVVEKYYEELPDL